jgi:hypothetical protein
MTFPSDLPPPEDVDQIMLELGTSGDLPTPAEAARTVIAAHRRYPDAIITLMLAGFDDDPREVCDIPEARDFFAGLLPFLAQCSCADSLADALDTASVAIMALCAGVLERDQVVFVPPNRTIQ